MDDSPEGQSPDIVPATFELLVEQSINQLSLSTVVHQETWNFGSEKRWALDQETGRLELVFDDGQIVTAPVQIIGTLAQEGDWMWAWNNDTIAPSLKADSLRVKEYCERYDIEQIKDPRWYATEAEAWAMTAIAARVCGAAGGYRGPDGPALVFMTFGEVTIARADKS